MESADVKALEKRIKQLERKITRTAQKQRYAEEQRNMGQRLYRKLQNDLQNMQEQLVHAEKHAALGQLTAGIAHEIKNPLNFINNFAEINEELADELKTRLEAHREAIPRELFRSLSETLEDLAKNSTAITSYGARADGIVKGMMEHASRVGTERELVDVNELVGRYVDAAADRNREQGVNFESTVEFRPGDDLPELEVVPAEIGKVVVSLIDNACDALAGRDDPLIVIETKRDGRNVVITVSDNGPGIPEEIRRSIFDPFFTTKPAGSGTGLGLSLAHDIVAQGHRGNIRFECPEEGGTTFLVSLPASR